ncbi:MAG: hypothetical protein K2O16_02190 [Lachnospiraceae bacterium]|nr:hypothetical protein [Lachnospiraceae bacterium]MDE7331039.1 hypothetical protein [Lachnospiraceae bacterium]
MQIGALSFRPYIYNTNIMTRNSMSKISAIGDDLTSGKTDFHSLSDEEKNENPLGKGQTVGFSDVLDKQMHMGRMNALRVMKPDTKMPENDKVQADDSEPAGGVDEMIHMQSERNIFQMQRAAEAYQMNMIA